MRQWKKGRALNWNTTLQWQAAAHTATTQPRGLKRWGGPGVDVGMNLSGEWGSSRHREGCASCGVDCGRRGAGLEGKTCDSDEEAQRQQQIHFGWSGGATSKSDTKRRCASTTRRSCLSSTGRALTVVVSAVLSAITCVVCAPARVSCGRRSEPARSHAFGQFVIGIELSVVSGLSCVSTVLCASIDRFFDFGLHSTGCKPYCRFQ